MNSILKTLDLQPADPLMILVCAVIFFFFWKILAKSLFLPYLQLLEKREAQTIGREHSAAEKLRQAAALQAELDRKITEIRIEAIRKKNEELKKVRDRASVILEKAETAAQEQLRKSRWQIAENMDSYKQEVFKEAEQMARTVVDRLRSPENFKMNFTN